MFRHVPHSLLALLVITAGCESSGPPVGTDAGRDAGATDAEVPIDAPQDAGLSDAALVDAALVDAGTTDAAEPVPCEAEPSDYTPRVSMSSTDTWAACISDDGAYHPIGMSISTIGRIDAFERMFSPAHGAPAMPGVLYGMRDPSTAEFTTARMIYQEANGLDSRVSRRADEHFEPVVDPGCMSATPCQCAATAAANPLYCVGPAVLAPLILSNLNRGIAGDAAEPSRVYAARVEAALLWFLHISPYKESLSCTNAIADCDSSWAYYTGGAPRESGLGLSRLVREADADAHDRIWDALLAVRCWRDLDGAATATDTALRDRARDQLDRATDRALVSVIVERLRAMQSSTGQERAAHHAFLSVLLAPIPETSIPDGTGGMLPVAAREPLTQRMIVERAGRMDEAAFIAAEIAESDPSGVDVDGIVSRLEALFPCP